MHPSREGFLVAARLLVFSSNASACCLIAGAEHSKPELCVKMMSEGVESDVKRVIALVLNRAGPRMWVRGLSAMRN